MISWNLHTFHITGSVFSASKYFCFQHRIRNNNKIPNSEHFYFLFSCNEEQSAINFVKWEFIWIFSSSRDIGKVENSPGMTREKKTYLLFFQTKTLFQCFMQ